MNTAYLFIYLGLLKFFQQCFVFYSVQDHTSLIKFIPKRFLVFFDVIVNGIVL